MAIMLILAALYQPSSLLSIGMINDQNVLESWCDFPYNGLRKQQTQNEKIVSRKARKVRKEKHRSNKKAGVY
jgi:hypothetical protein